MSVSLFMSLRVNIARHRKLRRSTVRAVTGRVRMRGRHAAVADGGHRLAVCMSVMPGRGNHHGRHHPMHPRLRHHRHHRLQHDRQQRDPDGQRIGEAAKNGRAHARDK